MTPSFTDLQKPTNRTRTVKDKSNKDIQILDLLHWLPSRQRVIFRIVYQVWRCLLGLVPAYLRDLCCPTPGRSSVLSMEREAPFVPFSRRPTSTRQTRAFSVVDLSIGTAIAPQGSF